MSITRWFLVAMVLILLQSCAGTMARREEAQFQKELDLKDEAWIAAQEVRRE